MPNSMNSVPYYRGAAIQDMMGKPPGWLLHSGLTGIAVLLVVLISLASFISYPEKVEASFLLQNETIPLAFYAKSSSVIDTVYKGNGQFVSAGDTLLIFSSEVDWKPIRTLDVKLMELEQELFDDLYVNSSYSISTQGAMLLGSKAEMVRYPAKIQAPYVALNTLCLARKSYLRNSGTAIEIRAFENEISDAERLSASLNKQVDLFEQELTFQQKQADRMHLLQEEGIVSDQEAEATIITEIGARRQKEVLISSDIKNQLRVQQLRQNILQKQLEHREQLADFDRQVLTQLKLLRTALNEYRETYLLIAKESGELNWLPLVREGATISPALPMGYLMKEQGSSVLVARLKLPTLGQGRVEEGDRVMLSFDAYPFREYGQVEGTVESISPIASPDENDQYFRMSTVLLPDSLTTTYGKQIDFQYNLSGVARIITADRTLLQRLFDKVTNLSKNS